LTYFYKHTLVVCRCSLVAKTLIVIQAQSSWSPSKNVFLISLRGIYVQLFLQLSFILLYCLYAPTTSQLNILTSKFLNIGKKYFLSLSFVSFNIEKSQIAIWYTKRPIYWALHHNNKKSRKGFPQFRHYRSFLGILCAK
jgi:hypothetical protein